MKYPDPPEDEFEHYLARVAAKAEGKPAPKQKAKPVQPVEVCVFCKRGVRGCDGWACGGKS